MPLHDKLNLSHKNNKNSLALSSNKVSLKFHSLGYYGKDGEESFHYYPRFILSCEGECYA
ncbi:hypothetical protein [Candidatus Ichthyocystis sparus]|uniref:hypothetical protein n=1 Tax=Candidatus Ichthyocystis sparus TaxID=1561004 RepID=UPI000B899DE3|nr:hypothetical protein [Candidatus Ichthyocystis sparus]